MSWEIFKRHLPWFGRNATPKIEANNHPLWLKCLNQVRKIVMWENTVLTAAILIGINIVFGLIVYLEFRFYGIMFLSILIGVLCDLTSRYVHVNQVDDGGERPSCREGTTSSDAIGFTEDNMCYSIQQLTDRANFYRGKLQQLRQEQPATAEFANNESCFGSENIALFMPSDDELFIRFFAAAFLASMAMLVVGHCLSGTLLTFMITTGIIIVPGMGRFLCTVDVPPINWLCRRVIAIRNSLHDIVTDGPEAEQLLNSLTEGLNELNADLPGIEEYIVSARTIDSNASSVSPMPSQETRNFLLETEMPSPRELDLDSEGSDRVSDIDIIGESQSSSSETEDNDFAQGMHFSEHTDGLPLHADTLLSMRDRRRVACSSPPCRDSTALPSISSSDSEDNDFVLPLHGSLVTTTCPLQDSDSDGFEIISADDL